MSSAEDTVLVTHLPSDSWFEGSAMRPNGQMLVARLDSAELYRIPDPTNQDTVPQLLHTFDNATGAINICPLKGRTDEYAVLSGIVDVANIKFENFTVWRIAFGADDAIQVTKLAELPDAGLTIAITAANDDTLLVADSGKACIWQLDLATGTSSMLIEDESMKVAADDEFFGVNRMCATNGFVYFTNTSAGTLCRVPIAADGKGVKVTGPVKELSDGLYICDGLALNPDGTTIYTASFQDGLLWRIDIDPASGEVDLDILMENLVSPTAVELVYVNEKPKIYVVCCGKIEVGWATKDKGWSDIIAINDAVAVTVTTEETVEMA